MLRAMVPCAPRIDVRLRRAIVRTDDPRRPIAETWRRVGALADRLGLVRPSYERVRTLVHAARARAAGPAAVEVAVSVVVRLRPEPPRGEGRVRRWRLRLGSARAARRARLHLRRHTHGDRPDRGARR